MRPSIRTLVSIASLALFCAGPAFAQDVPRTPEDMAAPQDRQARLDRMRKRLERMTPEQREVFKKRLEDFRSRSPEEKAELRRRMKDFKRRNPAERKRLRRLGKQLDDQGQREALKKKQERFRQMPEGQRRQYQALVHELIRQMPKAERRALAQLPPQERRHKIRSLLKDHRHRSMDKKLSKLPDDVRREAGRNMQGLQGKARFNRGRQMIDGYVRRQAQEIMRDRNLSPEQKRRRMRKLITKHVPKGPRREAMLRKMDQRARMHDRQQRDKRPGADRPGRPDGPGQRRRPMDDRDDRAPRRRTRRNAPRR